MSEQTELQNQFRTQQEKYYYYIVALSVTAIGFSVHVTLGQRLMYSQIPLGIAILSWALSCYFGLVFIGKGISLLFINNALLDVTQGKHEVTGTDSEKIEVGRQSLINIINTKAKKRAPFATWQFRFFFIGVFSFIVWHVLEMYLRTT